MRDFCKRSVKRPRPVLMLEALEDRRVMSASGLLSALHPLATAETSPSPLSSVLSSLVAVPTTILSSATTTVSDLGGTLLSGPVKGPTLGVSLNPTVDVLFLHPDNLRLDVSLNPLGSNQPLLTLGVGGQVAVGSTANSGLNVAPQVQVALGGSTGVMGDVGTQVNTPSGPVVEVSTGEVSTGTSAGEGAAGSVNTGAVQAALAAPTGGAVIAPPTSSAGTGANLVAQTSSTTVVNSPPTAAPAVIFGAPSTAAFLTAPNAVRVDGGGSGVDAAVSVAPVSGVAVADGAAAAAPARPIDLGGGTEEETVLVNPDMEAFILTTRFQPYSLDVGAGLGSLLAPVAPQSGWWTVWSARLSHMAPWLVGLITAGAALEIRRRRAKLARNVNAEV